MTGHGSVAERAGGAAWARLRARARLGGLGGRFAVILSGELIQSGFHFGLNLALVRNLSAHDYGMFAVVFIIGGISITYIRALLGVPASLFLTRRGGSSLRVYDVTFGSGAGLMAFLLALGVSAGFSVSLGFGALAAGAFVGLWAFRSYLRIVLLARSRARVAGLSDAVFAVCGTALAAVSLSGEGLALLDEAFAALAAAHGIAILVALVALRSPLRFSLRPRIRRRYAAILPTLGWSLLGITSINLQAQGFALVLAAVAGPAAYAPIAASLVLFAPLRIPTNALTNMSLPLLSEHLAAGRTAQATRVVVGSTLVIAAGCLLYGLAMAALLPLIESCLLAGRFAGEPMNGIGFGVWLAVSISLLYAIPRAYLEASGAFRTIATGALGSAALGFVVLGLVLATAPTAWALVALVLSELATLVWSLASFRSRSRGRCPARAVAIGPV